MNELIGKKAMSETTNNLNSIDQGSHREKVAILLLAKPNYDEFALKYFILRLNSIQSTYEFIFPEINYEFYAEKYYTEDGLFDEFERTKNQILFEGEPDYFINIITSKIEGNLFFITRAKITFITTDVWGKIFSPPSVFEYLLHCISASLIFMHPKIYLSSHHETRGCTLDYTMYKMDDKVDIVLGYLCDDCKNIILNGAGENYLKDISTIICRKWIGDIETIDSVAYNLKHFFKFDINKDSGFNKTIWENIKGYLPEIIKEIIVLLIGAIIGAVITLISTKVFR
jgi:hypothetical protein